MSDAVEHYQNLGFHLRMVEIMLDRLRVQLKMTEKSRSLESMDNLVYEIKKLKLYVESWYKII